MCDYCGCRTRPLIAELGHDHERIAALSAEVRKRITAGADDASVSDGARRLEQVLAPHSAREEAGLYVELDASGISAAALRDEHRHVDEALAAAAAAAPGDVDRPALVAALDVLDRHVHDEEYDLFPAAHQLLDDAAWDRLQR